MYSLLLVIIYIAFVSLGLPDSLLGAAWPAIRGEMNVPISFAGTVTMIIAGGTIVSSLLSERLTKKFKTQRVTLVSVLLTAAALMGFSISTKFWMLCMFAIPYGLGAGAIDAALNNYVALHYSSRHLSWLHCFWGLGAMISPYIMSYAITHSIWNDGYRYVAFIQFGIVFILAVTLPLWTKGTSAESCRDGGEIIGIGKAIKIKGVPTVLVGFFAYCAAEATTMVWASSYFVEARNVHQSTAASYGSLFFIGITTGRFINGFITDKFGDRKMIRIGTGIIMAGLICVALPVKPIIPAVAGFVLLGLGCAPIYPCIIHSTPGNFGKNNSQVIIGIQMASAYVGSTFVPPLFGILGQHIGLKILPFYCLIFFILMIFMTERTFNVVRRSRRCNVKRF